MRWFTLSSSVVPKSKLNEHREVLKRRRANFVEHAANARRKQIAATTPADDTRWFEREMRYDVRIAEIDATLDFLREVL